MSAVVLSGGRVLNIGGAAFSLAPPAPPPPVTTVSNYIKFNPGHWMGTENPVQGCPVAQAQTEINLLATGNTNVVGYWYAVTWSMLENFALTSNTNTNTVAGIDTQYPGFANFLETVANYLLIHVPTAHFGFWLTLDKESGGGAFTTTYIQQDFSTFSNPPVPQWMLRPSTLTVPDFFGASTTSLYSGPVGQIFSGASAHGFMFSELNSTANAYEVATLHWHNPAIVQGAAQMIQAMGKYVIKGLGAGTAPFAGKTFDQCSWFEGFSFNDEVSWNFTQNISGGSTVNPPQTTGGAPIASNTNIKNGYKQLMTLSRAAFPTSSVGICYSFGITTDSGTDSNTNIASDINSNLSGGIGLSAIQGLAMGSSDWFANEYNLNSWTNGQANPAFQGMLGIVSPVTPVIASPLAPNANSILGKMRWNKQLQAEDYHFSFATGGSVPAYSTALLTGIIQGTIYDSSTHVIWTVGDDAVFGTNAWTGATGWTAVGGVYGFLQTSASMGLSVLLPQFEMTAPQNLVAVATGTTTATVTWTGDTNAANTSHGWLIKNNGTTVGTVTTASVGTFNVTGLTAGEPCLFTVTMNNANGIGPPSSFTLTMPFVSIPVGGFTGSTSGWQFNSATANSGGFIGGALQLVTGGSHQAGTAWYKSLPNVQAFTNQYSFQFNANLVVPTTGGVSFAVQNSTQSQDGFPSNIGGLGAVGDANLVALGYFPPGSGPNLNFNFSVGEKFDLQQNTSSGIGGQNYNVLGGGAPSTTGLYINSGPGGGLVPLNDMAAYGINLYSGHVFSVTNVYDGSFWTTVIKDMTTGAQYRGVYPVNLTSATGANTAIVGFGAGNVPGSNPGVVCNILNWQYTASAGTRLATPTFSPAPGQYSGTQTIVLSASAGASIYYTTNGLLPSSNSTLYSGPITVSANTCLQTVAIQTGYTDSYVAQANYQIGTANVINFSSFAANDGVVLGGYATLQGTAIQLTDNNGPLSGFGSFEVGTAFYGAPVNIQSGFSGSFTYKATSVSTTNGICGITFCIQNTSPAAATGGSTPTWINGGATAQGNPTGLGYSGSTGSPGVNAGLPTSVAVCFDVTNGSKGGVGMVTDGAAPSTTALTTVSIISGNPITCAYSYSGTTLTFVLTDTVTAATQTLNFTVNIPTVVGGNTAYVGFTGATQYSHAIQLIQKWTMT